MAIVISDARCLILFTNIGRLDILNSLFGQIWITSEVQTEYGFELPDFVLVRDPADSEIYDSLRQQLDAGEASSIALASQNPGSKLVIDEKKGRRIAAEMGLDVTGTVGVLLEASEKGLIQSNPELVALLVNEGFRLSPRLKKLLSRSA
jgi:predicted nucleic acid-binding protein